MPIYLQTPLKISDLEKLKIGDKVFLSGTIYTGRDAAHKRLISLLEKNKPLPFPIDGAIIYYVGPAPTPPGKIVGSAGPTTSYRMDSFTPKLLDAGLMATIGKGSRNKEVRDSMKKNRAIYLVAIGGAAVVISKSIKKAEIIAYKDLGTEAIHKLEVENFPCIVANDIAGNDIFEQGVKKFAIKENM